MNDTIPTPKNEGARLAELESYGILDTMPEQEYDDIARLAAHICETSMSTVALLDSHRKWHKAKFGVEKESVPRHMSICSHTILGEDPLIVFDTLEHQVFRTIGMVVNPPHVRFYAGVPLINPNRHALGTLCVIDTKPNTLNAFQIETLNVLARQVVTLLELRRTTTELTAVREAEKPTQAHA